MLKRVEGDDADRNVELPRHQIGDDSFEVGPLNVGLAIGGAKPAEAVDYQIDCLIRAVGHDRHDRRGPACSRHTQTPTTPTGIVPAQKCVAPPAGRPWNFSEAAAFEIFNVTLGATNAQSYIS